MGAVGRTLSNGLDIVKSIGGWCTSRKVKKEEELKFEAKHKTANYFDKYGNAK